MLDIVNLYKNFDFWLNDEIDQNRFFIKLSAENYFERIKKLVSPLINELYLKEFDVVNDRFVP